MREILFRGQRITDKKWVEGFLLQGINKGVMLIQFWDDERGYCIEDIIPETVGQFTGLTDKNGVKIFEGDIIQDKYDESCNHVITYFEEESCFGVLYIGLNGSLTPMSRLAKDWINEFDEVVIGNIHKNPELLTEN